MRAIRSRYQAAAALQCTTLGVVVDAHDPEALVVAAAPLEVVHQRPREVPADVHAVGDRTGHGDEVTVEVGDAVGVLHQPVAGGRVVVGRAVLGDGDRDAVVALQAHEQLVEAVGLDLPPHGRQRRRPVDEDHAQRLRARVRAHARGEVVVDAEEVDRTRDDLQVALADGVDGPDAALEVLEHVLRVGAAQHGIQEPAVQVAVVEPRRLLLPGRRRVHGREVEGDPDVARKRREGQAVGEQQVVADRQRRGPVAQAGREAALGVAGKGRHPRLVVGDPGPYQVAQLARHVLRVLREALGGVAVGPATRVLQRLREVPVIERRRRLDAAFEQPLDQAAVEAHAGRVERAGPVGLHPRPRDREAVGLEAQGGHQVEVLAPAVVVVAGDLAGVAVGDGARHAAEGVPDRVAAPVDVRGPLDLVGGGGGAEAKSWREAGQEAGTYRRPGRRRLWMGGSEFPGPEPTAAVGPCEGRVSPQLRGREWLTSRRASCRGRRSAGARCSRAGAGDRRPRRARRAEGAR